MLSWANRFSWTAARSLQSQTTFKNWNAKVNAELVAANTLTLSFTSFERISLDG